MLTRRNGQSKMKTTPAEFISLLGCIVLTATLLTLSDIKECVWKQPPPRIETVWHTNEYKVYRLVEVDYTNYVTVTNTVYATNSIMTNYVPQTSFDWMPVIK